MTQTAQKPVQLTLETMLAKFREGFPSFVEPFEQIKPDLEAGTGKQALANLITCEVETRDEQGVTIYSWEGKTDPFELIVPKPFDPFPQRPGETQQQAQVQEEEEEEAHVQEEPKEAPDAALETPEPERTPEPQPEDTPNPQADSPELPETAETTAEAAPEATPGLFTALSRLLGDSTLLMTVARTGQEGDEPVLTVTVVPQEENSFTPMCLSGSTSELDIHFVPALAAKAESKKSLAEQIEAAKAADKELEEAKKRETEAKRKQAASKNKAAEKKEGEAKAEETKVAETAEAEKQQEKLF